MYFKHNYFKHKPAVFSFFFVLLILLNCSSARAVKYPDWVFQDFTSAYTLHKNDFELTATWLCMNDTIDFLDLKESEIGDSRLISTSLGDYSGGKVVAQYGLTDRLMLQGLYQKTDLDTSLGSSSTFSDVDSTNSLDTEQYKAGLRFKVLTETRGTPAVSLELSYRRNDSDDAGFTFTELSSSSLTIPGGSNSLMLTDLDDSGYSLTVMASKNMDPFVHTVFAGFGQYDSSSRLELSIDSDMMKAEIRQKFDVDEDIYTMGYTLGMKFFERMPIFISYKYIKTNVDMDAGSNTLSGFLPARYTDPDAMESNSENHVLSGKLVYWMTPNVNLTLDVTIYKNQFLGVVPHYNNSFTNRFFDYKYGYIGIGLGIAF